MLAFLIDIINGIITNIVLLSCPASLWNIISVAVLEELFTSFRG